MDLMHSRKHHGVRFGQECSVRFIARHDEYTDDEFASCWYDDEEFERIMHGSVDAVRGYRHGKLQAKKKKNSATKNRSDANFDEPDVRGLESVLSPRDVAQLKITRAACLDAVLNEQDRQYQQRAATDIIILAETDASRIDRNVEALRSASVRASSHSVRRALLRGVADARYVRTHVVDTATGVPNNDDDDEPSRELPGGGRAARWRRRLHCASSKNEHASSAADSPRFSVSPSERIQA